MATVASLCWSETTGISWRVDRKSEGHLDRSSLIGQGPYSELFAWGDGRVLKLFRDDCAGRAEEEARFTRIVQESGLAVSEVIGVIKVDGRPGIVYERIDGPTMYQRITAGPWRIVQSARLFAELHSSIHGRTAPGLPGQRQQMKEQIRVAPLPVAVRDSALEALDGLPDGNVLCHGDFGLKNVLMSAHGPVAIDWEQATTGNPLADVAKTLLTLLLERKRSSSFTAWPVEPARALIRSTYLRRYLQLRRASREEIAAWRMPVVVARMGFGLHKDPRYQRKWVALLETLLPRRTERALLGLTTTPKP